jgi:tetratricopeptide (TPR) repeat protein
VRAGFAVRLLRKGSAPDLYAIVERNLDLFKAAHIPTRLYPETTFESALVESYGALAFDIAYVLDDGVREAQAIDYYRLAIKLAPKNAPAYKNLGLVLLNRGAGIADVGPLWEQFLRLAPNDEQAPAIRQRLAHWDGLH